MTQYVTVESVSRDPVLRRERAQGNSFFPVQLIITTRKHDRQPYFSNQLAERDDHTYTHTYCSIDIMLTTTINSILPPVLSTCPLHTNSGCGKERRILIGPW